LITAETTSRLLATSSISGEGHLIVSSTAKVDLENEFVSGETDVAYLGSALLVSVVTTFVLVSSMI